MKQPDFPFLNFVGNNSPSETRASPQSPSAGAFFSFSSAISGVFCAPNPPPLLVLASFHTWQSAGRPSAPPPHRSAVSEALAIASAPPPWPWLAPAIPGHSEWHWNRGSAHRRRLGSGNSVQVQSMRWMAPYRRRGTTVESGQLACRERRHPFPRRRRAGQQRVTERFSTAALRDEGFAFACGARNDAEAR